MPFSMDFPASPALFVNNREQTRRTMSMEGIRRFLKRRPKPACSRRTLKSAFTGKSLSVSSVVLFFSSTKNTEVSTKNVMTRAGMSKEKSSTPKRNPHPIETPMN